MSTDNPNSSNLLRGSMIAHGTFLALQRYQRQRFDDKDREAIQSGLKYIGKVKTAQEIAEGKRREGFSETGIQLRDITYSAIRGAENLPNTASVNQYLRTLEETLEGVKAQTIDRGDLRINKASIIFSAIGTMLQARAAGPIETVKITELNFW